MYFTEEAIAATDERCLKEKLLDRTRAALLALEKEGHQAGWDSNLAIPHLFRIIHHPIKHHIRVQPQKLMNRMLHDECEANGGNVGAGMQRIARSFELTREMIGNTQVAAEEHARGYTLMKPYGYALRSEIWTTPTQPEERADPTIAEACRTHRLHEHPARVEARMVMLLTRDGLLWMVLRKRREQPEVVMVMPEGDIEFVGGIGNALARMIAAETDNPMIPVPKRE